MKIVHFIVALGTGGAEAIVKDYSIELKKCGHKVEVVTLLPLANTPNEQILAEVGIKVRSIYDEIYKFQSNALIVRAVRKLFKVKFVSRWIEQYIEETKPEVIHMHLSMQRFFVPIAVRLKHIRFVYTCHNEVERYFGDKHKKAREQIRYLIENSNMQMIALHDRMARELNDMFGVTNTYVLNNPIDIKRFEKAQEYRDPTRKNLNISENTFVVGHIGRFVYQKNHEMLVKIFHELQKKKPDSLLLMIGSGEMVDSVKQQLSAFGLDDKFLILSNRSDIPELLSAMDVFVFPSNYEGFGIAFLEAQISGIRCVGSDVMPESIRIVPSTEFLKLTAPIEKWVDAILSDTIQESIERSLVNDFDIATVTDKLVNTIYRNG